MQLRALASALLLLGSIAGAACSSSSTTTSSSSTSTSSSTSSSSTTSSASTTTSGVGGSGGAGGQGGSGGQGGEAGGGGAAAMLSLTSPAYSEGDAIPAKYACSGANVSPALDWTMGPAGTQSYAVVLTDKSNNLIHWVIWDIPAAVLSLPEAVKNDAAPPDPAGSKQVKSYDGKTFGYLGPCPPSKHSYELALFALDVATLPGVSSASSRPVVKAAILDHDLATATLTGTFTP